MVSDKEFFSHFYVKLSQLTLLTTIIWQQILCQRLRRYQHNAQITLGASLGVGVKNHFNQAKF